jgi:hypothetical protein
MRTSGTLTAAAVGILLAVAAAAPAGAATTTETYTPFAPDGTLKPGLTVTEELAGNCGDAGDWASITNVGAYRCATDEPLENGSNLLDPCFAEPAQDGTEEALSVICPGTPISRRVVRIQTGLILPLETARDRTPWALQIAGGRTCVLTSGASTIVRGQRVNYSCDGRGLRALVGRPRKRSATWTIAIVRSYQGAGYRRVEIKRAWY